ncbi:MAG: NAD(P)-binding domain-containing protein [Geminicoccaceae bacterium]
MKVGVLGCAGQLHAELQQNGLEPVCLARDDAERQVFAAASVAVVDGMADFFEALDYPRTYVLDVELGEAIDRLIDEAYVHMEPGDIVADPSGSYWCDTLRRYRRMRHRSIYYVDVARMKRAEWSHFLVSGDRKGIDFARPVLERWAGSASFLDVGGAGLAHYILMVEEARANIEAQARNEAALMMEAWPSRFDDDAIKELFPLVERKTMGRAAWQLDDALRLEAATPLMAQAVMLNLAEALDDQTPSPPAPRVGGFQHPDEIL